MKLKKLLAESNILHRNILKNFYTFYRASMHDKKSNQNLIITYLKKEYHRNLSEYM